MSAFLVLSGLVAVTLFLSRLLERRSRSKAERAKSVQDDIAALGDDAVPSSIHPAIDPDRCIGSGACVNACPEHDVIGIVNGQAALINPLACIGHGACAAACPVDAISLVFGTAKRGVDLPQVDEHFMTNQAGLYVIGELGGMGLIRNAVLQGRQAAEHVLANGRRGNSRSGVLDAIVVGAGPAGISATLALRAKGLEVLLLERDAFGGTIRHYPRAKVVMTGVLDLPVFGKVKRRTMSKEALCALWDDIRAKTSLPVITGELVSSIVPAGPGAWSVVSSGGTRVAANVLLGLGRRGAPRKLGVPGEDDPKVTYRLLEPEPFRAKHVLVVGGGNAAADCAIALAEDGHCKTVSLSYRRAELARLRSSVRVKVEGFFQSGKVKPLLPTEVVRVEPTQVVLKNGSREGAVPNDAIIVQIGGTSPNDLLQAAGVALVTKRGEA